MIRSIPDLDVGLARDCRDELHAGILLALVLLYQQTGHETDRPVAQFGTKVQRHSNLLKHDCLPQAGKRGHSPGQGSLHGNHHRIVGQVQVTVQIHVEAIVRVVKMRRLLNRLRVITAANHVAESFQNDGSPAGWSSFGAVVPEASPDSSMTKCSGTPDSRCCGSGANRSRP